MKIHCVWSRDLDVPYSAGRLRIARRIREALNGLGDCVHHVMDTLLERRRLPDMAQAAWTGTRHRLPMQCWLFDTAHNRAIADAIPRDTDVIYFDGIRTVRLVQLLRERLPATRLVVDLDDLMSRRTDELLKLGEGFSAGYMADKLPRWARSIGGPGLRYEREALRRWEAKVCDLADELVLLSPVEASVLHARNPHPRRAGIRSVPPPETIVRAPAGIVPPLRFVFIGTDGLTQNRLSIAYLLDLWRRLSPRAPLHIYGKMTRHWDPPPGVTFHGYADSLESVYDRHSILLSPSLLRGGVKTKVLEAFAWGTPVVGNAITFEGLPLRDYLLMGMPEDLVRQIDGDPPLRLLDAAARIGHDYVRAHHDPRGFAAAWREVAAGGNAAAAYAAD